MAEVWRLINFASSKVFISWFSMEILLCKCCSTWIYSTEIRLEGQESGPFVIFDVIIMLPNRSQYSEKVSSCKKETLVTVWCYYLKSSMVFKYQSIKWRQCPYQVTLSRGLLLFHIKKTLFDVIFSVLACQMWQELTSAPSCNQRHPYQPLPGRSPPPKESTPL